MTIGLGLFIACLALGAAGAAVMCALTARTLGGAAAAKEGAVLAASLGAFAAVCVCLGYGIGAQCLALVASLIPLRIGRRFLPPSVRDHMGGTR